MLKKQFKIIIAVFVSFCIFTINLSSVYAVNLIDKQIYDNYTLTLKNEIINISDLNLLKAINLSLGNGEITKPVTKSEIEKLTNLNASGKGIVNLEGLQYAINLKTARLYSNSISNVEPIGNLVNLQYLDICSNQIENIEAFKNLSDLNFLCVYNNKISNLDTLKFISKKNNNININASNQNITNENVYCLEEEFFIENQYSNFEGNLITPSNISHNGIYENGNIVWKNNGQLNQEFIYKIELMDYSRNFNYSINIKNNISFLSNPTIIGLDDIIIKKGQEFDLYQNVTATSNNGEIIYNIKINSNVDFSKEGIYQVKYIFSYENVVFEKYRTMTVLSNEAPVISGVEDIEIKQGQEFNPLNNVKVTDDHDENLQIEIIGEVDINKVGVYGITYKVKDSDGNETIIKRKVTVLSNEAPVISGVEDIEIKQGQEFNPLENVKVTDDHDENLQIEVIGEVDINKVGVYEITYKVKDNDGNETIVKRKVTVLSNEAPVISGVEDIEIKQGQEFNPLDNVKVTDDHDENLQIEVIGAVDINKVGVYGITYKVKDSDGNETIVKRKVTVLSNEAPVISGVEDIEIKQGQEFNPLENVKVTDDHDENLQIEVIGAVDINKVGVYEITYKVKDSDGNETIVKRKVKIISNNNKVVQTSINSSNDNHYYKELQKSISAALGIMFSIPSLATIGFLVFFIRNFILKCIIRKRIGL